MMRMKKELGIDFSLFAVCLGLLMALPTKAASLQLVTNDWGTNGVPTNVVMYIYVPDKLAANPPILVLLHYWGGGASGVFAEAQAGGIVAAADEYGFIMVVPQNPDCWDVNSTATLTHDGGGQTEAIAHMVNYTVTNYHANTNRVYATGTSCGAMMTEALLAVYPDVFKAGASFSGQVVGGAWTPITHTAQQWGNIVRACYPAYSGPRPRVQLWHGTADGIIDYSNQTEAILQWTDVLGLSANPTLSTTVTLYNHQWLRQIWLDSSGATALDAWSEYNGPHGTDANLNALNVIPFMGLNGVNLTYPWMSQDVGAVGVPGNATYSNGVFSVTGSGADIWGTADSMQFDYVPVNGNCTITARVASIQNVDPWSKAGVMIRESLNANAANAFIAVTSSNGVTWQTRSTTGGATVNSTTGALTAPYWVKLVRSGNTFTGYRSPDGATWTPQGTNTFNMASTAYIGLALTSHTNSRLCTATFDTVTAPGWQVSQALVPSGLSATFVSASQNNLVWNTLANATGYNVKRSTTNGGPFAVIASGVTATNYQDGGLPGNITNSYYYVVSAISSGGETPDSAEASLQYPKLTGSIIGTSGSYGGSGNTITNIFDNNLATYFDGPAANGCWAGLDFGAGVNDVITQIAYCPRSTFESRMVGGVFQGANHVDFSDAVTLYTVGTQPATGVFTPVSITNTAAFRYVRYLSPNNGWGNVAEVQFYGYPSFVAPPVPNGLTAAPVSSSQINLVWNVFTNATGYNVKRSTTNGGPYSVIASGVTATNYPDSGLNAGTIYYYVVSTVVSGSETSNSVPAAAATLSGSYGSLLHRYSFGESGGSSVDDSIGGPVWNGTLPSGGTLGGGQLALSAAASQYASLPPGIVGGLSNFTVVAWVNLNSLNNWSRIFDFGANTTTNMFLTPQNGNTGTLRFGMTTNGGGAEQQINCGSVLTTGMWHEVAVTLNAGTGILYLDGAAVGTNSGLTLNPAILGSTASNYIGKSQYPDPYFNGQLDEFSIYGAALSPREVAAAYAMGPNQLLSTNSPPIGTALTGANLTLTWPLASAGFTLQSRTNLVLGNWVNVASPAPQMIGGQWQVSLPQSGNANSTFYRLVK